MVQSKLYLNHSPTALRLSHLTVSSSSCISSMTLAFNPIFSNAGLFSGTSLTRHATSLHPIAKTCLSLSQLFDRISANFFGISPLFSSRILRAFSRQNVGLRCGGLQRKCPESTSALYESNVVCVFVYSSSVSLRLWRSSRRSWSLRCLACNVLRRLGRRAKTAAGSRVCGFAEMRFLRVLRRRRVVFSLGDSRSS
jgi:hypothetical protein